MVRAAVLIGVRGRGDAFPRLQAVDTSIASMRDWLRGQGIEGSRLIVISDEESDVTIASIKTAIATLLNAEDVTQLFIYFSGHGVCIGSAEFWLLSGAPDDPDEAVNVDSSVQFARRLSVPHTVLISDACRSPLPDVQGQSLIGGSIIPNQSPRRMESSVDVYFGCALGTPSLEVKAVQSVGSAFESVFTSAFVDATMGKVPSILDVDPMTPGFDVIRAWPLKSHLATEVTRRLIERKLPLQINQTPDARITSPPDAWISMLPETKLGSDVRDMPHGVFLDLRFSLQDAPPMSLEQASAKLIYDAIHAGKSKGGLFGLGMRRSRIEKSSDHSVLQKSIDEANKRQSDASLDKKTSVLRIFGSKSYKLLDMNGDDVTAESIALVRDPVSVVLVLGARFALVPIMPGVKTFVFCHNGVLVDIRIGGERDGHLRGGIDAIIEAAGAAASFNPAKNEIRLLAAQYSRALLSFASELHLAYAMYDRGMTSEIAARIGLVRSRYGFGAADFQMLSYQLLDERQSVAPKGLPMLARGWALVEALVIDPPESWRILRRYLGADIWSSYHSNALDSFFHAHNSRGH
jgi:hypothetical protein